MHHVANTLATAQIVDLVAASSYQIKAGVITASTADTRPALSLAVH
jgi:hypothetical protein